MSATSDDEPRSRDDEDTTDDAAAVPGRPDADSPTSGAVGDDLDADATPPVGATIDDAEQDGATGDAEQDDATGDANPITSGATATPSGEAPVAASASADESPAVHAEAETATGAAPDVDAIATDPTLPNDNTTATDPAAHDTDDSGSASPDRNALGDDETSPGEDADDEDTPAGLTPPPASSPDASDVAPHGDATGTTTDGTATNAASAASTATLTATAEPESAAAGSAAVASAPTRTGSWADDLWARFTATAVLRHRTEWILLGAVTLLAALLRLVGLAHPGFLVFDETFYVKDAWSLVHLGYEAKWPENANDSWASGNPDVYFDEPSYVVHPPLGKLVIGLGMLLFGADNPFGWRIGVAIIGTLAVPLMWLVARKLFGSPVLATIAAFLLAIDGHAIVTSRVSILDGILMFFVLLGFLFVLLDRQDFVRRLDARILDWRRTEGATPDRDTDGDAVVSEPAPIAAGTRAPAKRPSGPDWGPAIWNRPWLVAAAVAFGLASSVKWSGLYFLAAFCLYTVVVDAWERRRRGVTFWASAAVLKQGPVSFLLTVPAAFVVYLTTWTGWLSTTGGFYRTWADEPGNAWTGALAWVPRSVQSLWHYSSEAYKFHTNLAADHPYQSSPIEWPFLIRPTAFSYEYSSASDNAACHAELCVEAITSISNPIIWWSGTVAVIFCAMMLVLQPRWQLGPILVGVGAGYLPWLGFLERQAVFQFYAIAFLPFMILAIVYLLYTIVPAADAPRRARTLGVNVTAVFLVVCTLVSALFLPVWTGVLIPDWYWSLTHWLPGWK